MKVIDFFKTEVSKSSLKDALCNFLELTASENKLEVLVKGNIDEERRLPLGTAIMEAVYCVQYMISSLNYCDNNDMDRADEDAKISDEHFDEMKRALLAFVED